MSLELALTRELIRKEMQIMMGHFADSSVKRPCGGETRTCEGTTRKAKDFMLMYKSKAVNLSNPSSLINLKSDDGVVL